MKEFFVFVALMFLFIIFMGLFVNHPLIAIPLAGVMFVVIAEWPERRDKEG
jgi:hypothetical protein